MAIAPEHFRAARLAVPRLPLPAIVGFTVLGVAGSVFLACTTFIHSEKERSAAPSNDARVYEARAVPFDAPREDPAKRAASIARVLTATQRELSRGENNEFERPSNEFQPLLIAESNRELRGFEGFGSFAGANNYLSIAGTSFGIGAQTTPSGFAAPDAETAMAAPVPETSTWICGAGLFVLVAARGMRARLHRNRIRSRR